MTSCELVSYHRYRDAPLSQVLADLQLYTPRRIVLGDSALGNIRVVATTDARKTETFVRNLGLWLPVEVDDTDPQIFLIRCLSPGCPELEGWDRP